MNHQLLQSNLKIKYKIFSATILFAFFSTERFLGNAGMFFFFLSSCNKARFQDHTIVFI